MRKKKEIALPIMVKIQVTEKCNLRCKMCYYWGEKGCLSKANHNERPVELDIEVAKRVIKELTSNKRFYSLSGGEPLMFSHLEEIIRALF